MRAIEPLVPGSPEWLSRITASQVAAIVGVSPWTTAYALWHQKMGNYTIPENKSMATGTHWEPEIRDWYRAQNPDLEVTGELSFEHSNGWAAANPDGVIDGCEGLEIKTSRYGDGWGEPGTDQVAKHYLPQIQWGLWVTGFTRWRVLMCTPWDIYDRTYREYMVERDQSFIDELVEAAEGFRLMVDLGVEPDTDWRAKIDRDILRATSGPRSDDSVELDDETATTWLLARQARIDAETAEDAAKAQLLAYAGTARRLVYRNREIAAFRNSKNGPALYPAKGLEDMIPSLTAPAESEAA